MNNKYIPLLFIPLALIFLLIYSWSTSPLYVSEGGDSCIFKIIGLGFIQGKVPYVDLFDHKGGFLFLIQALGFILLPNKLGVFVIQLFNLSITLYFLYKTARLFVSPPKSFVVILLTMIYFISCIQEGNQCEEYMLSFITVSLYLCLKCFVLNSPNSHPIIYSLIYGIAFACIFWIRPNDSLAHVGAIFGGTFIYLLYEHKIRLALLNLGSFIFGYLLVSISIILFYWTHDALRGLLEGTLLYNIKYTTDIDVISKKMIVFPLLCYLGIIWMLVKSRLHKLVFIFLPIMILTIILIGKRNYAHYLIVLVPYVTILLTLLISTRKKWICIFIASLFVWMSVGQQRTIINCYRLNPQMARLYCQTSSMIYSIPEDERDDIWSLNLHYSSDNYLVSTMGVFLNAGITPCNRIFVPSHIPNFGGEEKIEKKIPKWILADPSFNMYNTYKDFLYSNYDIIECTDKIGSANIILYKRKGL